MPVARVQTLCCAYLGRVGIVNSWCPPLKSCRDTVACGLQQLAILWLKWLDERLIELCGYAHKAKIFSSMPHPEVITVLTEPREKLEKDERLIA
jgi:hypothetical protein